VAKKANPTQSVHLTDRALRDIAGIELHSTEKFGKRVAAQYVGKIEAGIGRILENPDLLRQESLFHESLKFYRIEQNLLVCETGIEGKIIILTLLHASMDIPSRLAELEPNLSMETELLLKQLHRSTKP
jgi:plasmid stabilization system protein ParE